MKTTKKSFSTDYLLEDLFRRAKSFMQFHVPLKKTSSKYNTLFNPIEEIN